ncbi:MAG TPA: transcription antitermination factor NusB [Burkholderiales bacterium]|nr:transcription antitermination factor NusB [Burkholderiales bacterium]
MQDNGKQKRRDNPPKKSPRRRSRELALQGLYQWQLTGKDTVLIATELAETEEFGKADVPYFRTLLNGAIERAGELDAAMTPFLDRATSELSPIERGVLLISGYELMNELEVPYRVVINEGIELAKAYGGTDGHKYVNGVLDKLAARFREIEVTADRGTARRGA